MTPEKSAHLSEEAVNDVLIGLGSSQAESHLAECANCRGRVETFHSDMRSFNQTSLAWSEARQLPAIDHARIAKSRPWIGSPLSWALAVALLIVVGLPLWNRQNRDTQSESAMNRAPGPASSSSNSEAQIAQDNDLLRSVNVALNESEESPIDEYHLSAGVHASAKIRPELRKE